MQLNDFWAHPLADGCCTMAARKVSPDEATGGQGIFLELFAGRGLLTSAVSRVMQTEPPQDFGTGGVDFTDLSAVQRTLWSRWRVLRESGFQLFFHVAPPCATFSRARDRAWRTRLRSPAQPGGLYPADARTKEGNLIAYNTALSVVHLVRELDAKGTWEQPAGSYMFRYLEQEGALDGLSWDALTLSQCRFGRPFKKPTTFLLFGGLSLPTIDLQCDGFHTCGRRWHAQLGFGHLPTAPAAEYPRGLCTAYAQGLSSFVHDMGVRLTARERVAVVSEGKVKRHVDRGRWSSRGGNSETPKIKLRGQGLGTPSRLFRATGRSW